MEIRKEVIEAQGNLSKVNIDFFEYVEKNPNCFNRSGFQLLELNDWLFTLQPWPTFISRETKKIFQEAGVKIFNLIKTIPRRVFNNDPHKISEYFNLPLTAVKIQLDGEDDEHIDHLLGRGDFIFSSTGLKCLEYNVSANLGGVTVPIWEKLYLNTPIIAKFLGEYHIKINNENLISLILEHVIDLPLKKLPGYDDEMNIAVIMNISSRGESHNRSEIYLNELYKKIFHPGNGNRKITGKVFMCDFRDLTVDDGYVFYKGKKLRVIIEMCHGVVPPKIIESFKSGKVYLINGPISQLLSNKLTLAVLSNYGNSDAFTAEEKEIIDKYIPWTRKITPGSTTYGNETIDDLEHFIGSNREKLVIKPSRGLGGEGICVGLKSSREEWEIALKRALKEKDWLVQEYVRSTPGFYQSGEEGYDYQDMVWGFFIIGSRYIGAWNRVMPGKDNRGVINCHQGATVSIIFEVNN
jgi:hypothetical protein